MEEESDGFSEMKWSVKGTSHSHGVARTTADRKLICAPIVEHHSNATAHQSSNRRRDIIRTTPSTAPLWQKIDDEDDDGFFYSRDG